jgi:anti-anti-sigma regulatory factor
MDELIIRVRHRDEEGVTNRTTSLELIGPLARGTAQLLRDHLRHVINQDAPDPCPLLLLDMSHCTYVDVDGLLALAVARTAARSRGGDLHLTQLPPLIERQVRQHNLEELIQDGGDAQPSPLLPTSVPKP